MKIKNAIFSLVGLCLTVASAIAASPSEETSPALVLPAYVVKVPRQTSGEKAISQNLAALRALATKPIAVPVELSLPGIKSPRVQVDKKSPTKAVVVAAQ